MGLLDGISDGLDKVNRGLDAVNRRVVRALVTSRIGTITDSVRGPVEVVDASTDTAFGWRLSGAALPPVHVDMPVLPERNSRVTIGSTTAEIVPGREAMRRATYIATARLAASDVEYRLRPRRARRAEFRRDGVVVARLRSRRRLRDRRVDWDTDLTADEAALCHAMAVRIGIGARGFASHLLGEIGLF